MKLFNQIQFVIQEKISILNYVHYFLIVYMMKLIKHVNYQQQNKLNVIQKVNKNNNVYQIIMNYVNGKINNVIMLNNLILVHN